MIRFGLLAFLSILIMGCATGATPGNNGRSHEPMAVLNKTWQWVATITPVEKIEVAEPQRYTIFLAPSGKAQMRFDCNRGGGGFTIAPGQLSFGPLISTRMACPPDTLDAAFMRDLQRVASFFIESGVLFLELPYDSGTMKFQMQE